MFPAGPSRVQRPLANRVFARDEAPSRLSGPADDGRAACRPAYAPTRARPWLSTVTWRSTASPRKAISSPTRQACTRSVSPG